LKKNQKRTKQKHKDEFAIKDEIAIKRGAHKKKQNKTKQTAAT